MKRHFVRFLAAVAITAGCCLGAGLWTDGAEAAGAGQGTETVTGTLEIIAECEEADGRILYFLDTGTESLSIRFADPPVGNLRTGAKVAIRGVKQDDGTFADGEASVSPSGDDGAVALPGDGEAVISGEIRVLVLLVNFQDNQSQPYTAAQARCRR